MTTNDDESVLELHWSESPTDSDDKQLFSDPTKYEDYSLHHKVDGEESMINVDFNIGPLIHIQTFEDKELYEEEICSMQNMYQLYLDKERKYLIDLHLFIKKFDITSKHFAIYCHNMQHIAWRLCLSRRIYQQSLQYLIRYLCLVSNKQFSISQIDLLGCVCLRLSSKHNLSRYEKDRV